MSATLETKYEAVLSWEQSSAKAIARTVIKAHPISVWEVMIPFILIANHMRLAKTREICAQNLLYTKKLALEAARAMMREGQSRKAVMSRIEERTSSVLASVDKGIYSEEIRRKQIEEMDLLIDHYCTLLEAEGEDYASLVMNGYRTQSNYTEFLGKLSEAEKQVTLAASKTLGTQTDPEKLSRMEESTERVRMAEVERIFGTKSPRQDAE